MELSSEAAIYYYTARMVKFFKNYLWQSAILALSNFELLQRKFKYFITALTSPAHNFFRTPLEKFCVFWKFQEGFNPEYLTNPILAGNNSIENFNADVPVEIFQDF